MTEKLREKLEELLENVCGKLLDTDTETDQIIPLVSRALPYADEDVKTKVKDFTDNELREHLAKVLLKWCGEWRYQAADDVISQIKAYYGSKETT